MQAVVFVPSFYFFPTRVSIATGTLKEQFEISVLEIEVSYNSEHLLSSAPQAPIRENFAAYF